MRIIDNKKDYYDYLAGVYGIDKYITFDRRNSFRIRNNTNDPVTMFPNGFAYYFDTNVSEWHTYGIRYNSYNDKSGKKSDRYPDAYSVNTIYGFGIIIGNIIYVFNIDRVLKNKDDETVTIIPRLVYKGECDRSKMNTTAPIIIGEAHTTSYFPWNREKENPDSIYAHSYIISKRNIKVNDKWTEGYYENPIFEGTWIPSMIPADEVWNNITDYLLSLKDPKIVDNRTDIQHLESHGFDKKESFRNVK